MVIVYIFDTNAFSVLGSYYPSAFPSIWNHIDKLVENGELLSVLEVRREIETNFPYEYIVEWVHNNRKIFKKPTSNELKVVREIFEDKKFQDLIKLNKIIKGLPEADPFIIAAAKVKKGIVVTQESYKPGGARIPNVCEKLGIDCINMEEFLEREGIIL